MAQASAYSSQNFSVSYYDRLPRGGGWINNLDISLQDWRHSISAFGGFDTASFSLPESQIILDDWLANGLFRPIAVFDNYLDSIWEGFVDSITANQAGLSITIGPVTEIANRIFAIYSGVDTSVYPPQIGVRKRTPNFNNLISQADWGIWWKILSLAGVTDANADQLVGMYLSEHGHDEKNSNFNFSNEEISLTVNCVGWSQTLNYPFNHVDTGGDIAINDRIKEILAAHPNPGWISSDYGLITPNSITVPTYESDDQLAIEHLRGLSAMGDINNLRYTFGVYEDRKAVYEPVSQQIDYTIELADPRRLVLDSAGAVVQPWKIRPGKWIFFSDFLPGLGSPYAEFHLDPRMLRVETVQFDMRTPYAVQFSGGISSKYESRSARLGLRGTEV